MKRHPSLIPLSHEHQHGLALAVMIDRRSKPDAELAERVAAIWDVELANHFRVEEAFVFPAAVESLADSSLVEELIAQHRELERRVRDVAAAEDENRRGRLEAFGELLSRHIRIEERRLFEAMQEALDADELVRLGEVVERESKRACLGP